MKLVLASSSPRRRRLLDHLVDGFEIDAPEIDETAPAALPIPEALQVIARKKALEVTRRFPDAWVLGADTVVSHHGGLLGKARTPDEARLRLASLSGETHQVWTGIALAFDGRAVDSAAAVTAVHMDRLPTPVFDAYIASGQWQGKAGGYGIQDALLAPFLQIKSGPWSNVVGLPLAITATLLRSNGIATRDAPDEAQLAARWLQGPSDGA